jgi:hypothetical protein
MLFCAENPLLKLGQTTETAKAAVKTAYDATVVAFKELARVFDLVNLRQSNQDPDTVLANFEASLQELGSLGENFKRFNSSAAFDVGTGVFTYVDGKDSSLLETHYKILSQSAPFAPMPQWKRLLLANLMKFLQEKKQSE